MKIIKGKKIEFAPTTEIKKFFGISNEFMKKIFDLNSGEYVISDESSLYDFMGIGIDDVQLSDIHKKIRSSYDIDASGIKSGNLKDIFQMIYDSRQRHSCWQFTQ